MKKGKGRDGTRITDHSRNGRGALCSPIRMHVQEGPLGPVQSVYQSVYQFASRSTPQSCLPSYQLTKNEPRGAAANFEKLGSETDRPTDCTPHRPVLASHSASSRHREVSCDEP